MKVLVFDTETTGLPTTRGFDKYYPYTELKYYDTCRIVSICWKLYEDEKMISTKYYVIKPNDFKIDNTSKACEINGITQEIADKDGILIDNMLIELRQDLYKAETVVAHNILFDHHILLSELHRSKRQDLIQLFESKELYCTMNKSKDLLRIPMKNGNYKSPKLIELYEFLFKTGFEGAHNAEADVEACAKCYFELIKNNIL